MATFDTRGDRRWSPTDWPGGGEGAPADDRVAGGQSTPDEVIRPMNDGLRMQPGSGGARTDGTTEIAGERSLADDTETAGGGSPQRDVREALGCDSFDLDAILAAFLEWAGRLRDIGLELRDGTPADPSARSETSDQSRGQADVTVDTRSSVPSQDVVLVPWHHQDDFRFI